ncbi:MAG: hypothetical protein M1831_004267 [Alyxoria varia]|nr:MAG: hypothetical protein M1831_004267 [Alyxoria varia]
MADTLPQINGNESRLGKDQASKPTEEHAEDAQTSSKTERAGAEADSVLPSVNDNVPSNADSIQPHPNDPLQENFEQDERSETPSTSGLVPQGSNESTTSQNGLSIKQNGAAVGTESGNNPKESRSPVVVGANDGNLPKEKKKGVSFLSRFIVNKKRDNTDDTGPMDADATENRPEGAAAQAFYQHVDNVGYSPRHAPPPPYIKVGARYKKEREFNRLFLAQNLQMGDNSENASSSLNQKEHGVKRPEIDGNAIWSMEFSTDGKHLASAGQDKKIRVWSILSYSDERRGFEQDEDAKQSSEDHVHLSAPVFRSQPIMVFEGHEGAVLDLSWSKNNFLLSSSMDRTIRLWHVSRQECLCAFKHTEFVTSIQFHPQDDRFFLAGSMDAKLRLWSIPDKSVAFWNQLPEMVTAVCFTPDGKQAIAGCSSGLCLFYETEGLRYQTQIHAKSTHGKNARGSKITGLQTINLPHSNTTSVDTKLLVTSNDSRIRLYNLRDKSLEMKFKGNTNTSSHIKARFNDNARYVICGSEDKRVYIWSTQASDAETMKKNKWPVEVFEAHTATTTVSMMAPTRSRQLLGASEDPIYDICNPPPVTLVSKSEAAGSIHSASRSINGTDAGSIRSNRTSLGGSKSINGSPTHTSRSAHINGNLIITADEKGALKVFRQDCAWDKRRISDPLSNSETSSLKRVGTNLARRTSLARSTSSMSSSINRQNSSASAQRSRDHGLNWTPTMGASSASLERNSVSSTSIRAQLGANLRGDARSTSPAKMSFGLPRFGGSASAKSSPMLGATNGNSDSRKASTDTTSAAASALAMRRQRSPGAAMTNGSSNQVRNSSPSTSSLLRGDSSTYFKGEAWKDGMAGQLSARGRTAEVDENGKSPGVGATDARDKSASSRGSLPHLEPQLSGFSALSSAEPSPQPDGKPTVEKKS